MGRDAEKDEIAESFLAGLKEQIREMTTRLLQPKTPESALALALNLPKIYQLTLESMSNMYPPPEPVACEKGCNYCCHLLFFCDALTTFLVADHLVRMLDRPEMERLHERLLEFAEEDFGIHTAPRPPCPLLADGICLAFEFRPLVCRAQSPMDVAQCEDKYLGKHESVVSYGVPISIWLAISEGLSLGLAESGFEGDGSLEFSSALKVALETPDGVKKWLDGTHLFENAKWNAPVAGNQMRGQRIH
jgi:hypothetical protein